jgi:dihydroorotate dehydrogenase
MTLYRRFYPALSLLDPESAHGLTIAALKSGLLPGAPTVKDESLHVDVFGIKFPNPVGLAAGFDKNAEVYRAMLRMGFGFVEVGSITPRPQTGNPRPRIFRLSEDRAVINRLGFNNKGAADARLNLSRRRKGRGIIGVNVGANKDTADRMADYVVGFKALAEYADYVTVNISSPNTPGLRGLQNRNELEELLGRMTEARTEMGFDVPLLLKIAPDVKDRQLADIVSLVTANEFDGMIVSNTTIDERDSLLSAKRKEEGGLSGRPLFKLSTSVLRSVYQATDGKLPLVGVGGVSNGWDAYEKIRNGASLVQLYTAMTFEGPHLAYRIAKELRDLLAADGFENISAVVGIDAR